MSCMGCFQEGQGAALVPPRGGHPSDPSMRRFQGLAPGGVQGPRPRSFYADSTSAMSSSDLPSASTPIVHSAIAPAPISTAAIR